MHGEKMANAEGGKNWTAVILLAAFVMVGAYMLYAVSKTEAPQAAAQEKPRETTRIAEAIKTVLAGGEKTEGGTGGDQSTPEENAETNASTTNQPAKKPVKVEGNRSASQQQMPPAPPSPSQPQPEQETTNTITTTPTRKISDNKYIAGLETDGKVKIYAHEAEGRMVVTNDTIPEGWYSKIAYDPLEGECFITIYVDEDAVLNSQNLTYGCRMRGNIETGCSNTLISNWGTKTGNLYSYEYEESCTQQGSTVKIDGVQKDLLTSGI